MARYKVLRSVAHNFAHSFASVMNHSGKDYTMCHLMRRAKLTGSRRLYLDVLTRRAGPLELLSTPIVTSCTSYCKDFGRLVTASGAALDMIESAELHVIVALARELSGRSKALHGRVTARMRIRDDRGKIYEGTTTETYQCSPLR